MASTTYRQLHWVDKGLDILLLLGVLSGAVFLVVELFLSPGPKVLQIIHRADVLLLGIFLGDITRTFFKSRNFVSFLKHQWFDLSVLVVIIISFSAIAFVGVGRLSYLLREERAFAWLNRLWKVPFIGRWFGR
ncbi:TPA: hypothetical protein HA242_00315 [Candidatus Woesearchaeota archaeon]|nr:hypothetical protein [Candidatus Woesearchaeota archaeon]